MLDVSGGTVLVDSVDVRLLGPSGATAAASAMATQRVRLYSDTVEQQHRVQRADDISETDVDQRPPRSR